MRNNSEPNKPEIPVTEARETALSWLPKRIPDSNKGTYGKVLLFAGSFNMAGAAAFSAKAAYRTGAGLVRVVTDDANRTILQTLVPEAILATYDDKTTMEQFVWDQTDWADAIVLGPGIGTSRQAEEMVHAVLKETAVPTLVDADGLNILATHLDWLKEATGENLIVTPHPGEMSRLLRTSTSEVKENLAASAKAFSEAHGVVCVLKDARTVTAVPDGRVWVNTSGNNGMATGGSGDVLSGIIGALLGQGVSAERAAVLGVLLHGMAGDAAAKRVGKTSLIASDIIDSLPEVLREREETESEKKA